MRRIVRSFDHLLCRLYGVFLFWDDPECMFRVQLARARQEIVLPGARISPGARVLLLHLWNEQMPQIPTEGPDLAFALRMRHMIDRSFRVLARELRRDPRLDGVQALGGATVLFSTGDGSGGEKLFTRLGFSAFPYRSPLGRFGEFWENAYTWAIMWAYSAGSLRDRRLMALRRTEVWMTADRFLGKYGSEASGVDRARAMDTERGC